MDFLTYITPGSYFNQKELAKISEYKSEIIFISKNISKLNFNKNSCNILRINKNCPYSELRNNEKVIYKNSSFFIELEDMTNKDEDIFLISGNSSSDIYNLIQFIYSKDDNYGKYLLSNYLTSSAKIFNDDLVNGDLEENIDSLFDIQTIIKYLKINGLIVNNLNINFSSISDNISNKNDDEIDIVITKLYEDYNNNIDISKYPSYCDLDYLPVLVDGHYCIKDYSSQSLFVVKNIDNHFNIYYLPINSDFNNIKQIVKKEHHDYFVDFLHDKGQDLTYLVKSVTAQHLIAEIKDNKIISAAEPLSMFFNLHNFIYNELNGKDLKRILLKEELDTNLSKNNKSSLKAKL